MMKHQKSVTSVYSALYREKLCNHCIQGAWWGGGGFKLASGLSGNPKNLDTQKIGCNLS